MGKFFKLLLAIVIAVVLLIGAGIVLERNGIENPLSGITRAAMNSAVDSSGLKAKAQRMLNDNVDLIAKKAGVSKEVVRAAIDSLAIEDWQVTNLPSDAKATGSSSFSYGGTSATITTYDDPSVITVNTGGMDITFEIPPSAQGSLGYLQYLS